MNVFEKAKNAPSFNYWLEELPEEDLRYLSNITDEVNDNTLKDTDTFEQMVALCLYFSGVTTMTEKEMEDSFRILTINISVEINVREGKMTKTGIYSMIKGEESAKFSMTEKGMDSVNKMLNKDNPDETI